MKKIFLFFLLLLGLFFIYWAIAFYYYNPTIVGVKTVGMLGRQTKIEISLVFFWGLIILGLGLVIFSLAKLLFKRKNHKH